MFTPVLSVLFASLVVAVPTTRNQALQPVVHTRNGTLVGVHSSSYDQDFFLDIPYAAPPVGELRFQSPAPYEQTYHQRDASHYGSACFGYNTFASISQVYTNYSEDCLTLNIVRPANSHKLPVVVWIHGGGFQFGSGIDTRYNMSYLVQQSVEIGAPIIGITINYRLGPWGYLASSEILDDGAANAGLKDQRIALLWLQENIAAFGGDPNKVTIQGESAGATSVGYQILAYGGNNENLFRSAIMESGSVFSPVKIVGVEFYQPIYDALLKKVNCASSSSSLECLRALPSSTLQATLSQAPFNGSFTPFIDGTFLPYFPSQALAKGAFAHVPIIIGTNSDEGTIFVPAFNPAGVNSDADFERFINISGIFTPSDIQTLTSLYPNVPSLGSPYNTGNDSAAFPPTLGSQFKRAASYAGDFLLNANKRRTAQAWVAAGLTAYTYRFNTLTTSSLPNIIFGVYHTTEIAFVFHNIDGVGYSTGDPFANQPSTYFNLADYMSHLWIGFIANTDPNSVKPSGSVAWPEYSTSASNLVFQPNASYLEMDNFRSQQLAFINANPGKYMR